MGQLIVQRYGGSSVADPEKIEDVARRIADSCAGEHRLVVVVSAMGKTTDGLLALAGAITANPDAREMDVLLSTREQATIGLLAMALQSLGQPACSFTGSQVGLIADRAHLPVNVKSASSE
jgi:aspartate kinase